MSRHNRILEITRIVAKSSDCRYKFAASIAYGSRIVSIATNIIKSHPILQTYGDNCISIHAEVNAILKAEDTADATIYVARYSKDGILDSFPCKYCLAHIITAQISTIVYNKNGKIELCRL